MSNFEGYVHLFLFIYIHMRIFYEQNMRSYFDAYF